MVVREMVETETASFWYESPEVQRGELRSEDIQTEVFLMPAAGHAEKYGTFTNTQRLLQWLTAVDPPGDSRSENWFIYHLGVLLKEKAKRDPRPRNAGLLALTWDYHTQGEHHEPVAEGVLQGEINGYTWADRKLVPDSHRSKPMDRPRAVGFTAACSPKMAKTALTNVHPRISMDMDGALRGLPTAVFFITARPLAPTATHGVNEKARVVG